MELNERFCWVVHERVDQSVDLLLQGFEPRFQVRRFEQVGRHSISVQNTTKDLDYQKNKSTKSNKNWRKSTRTPF